MGKWGEKGRGFCVCRAGFLVRGMGCDGEREREGARVGEEGMGMGVGKKEREGGDGSGCGKWERDKKSGKREGFVDVGNGGRGEKKIGLGDERNGYEGWEKYQKEGWRWGGFRFVWGLELARGGVCYPKFQGFMLY
ncbi:hypothetical protein Pyn_08944 [Prunus yedoensis var. nudiflora]|uniref:Uncharacterized protein n=1 Tax=Prunus yedoensis var. nudiflora TaxID=2094558 RepID=A0A314YVV6_PRUYE|nr:hypothetical protein Pyn_08944 [Prunus yedoensis var. nudiflora]